MPTLKAIHICNLSCPKIGLHQNLKKWIKKVKQLQD